MNQLINDHFPICKSWSHQHVSLLVQGHKSLTLKFLTPLPLHAACSRTIGMVSDCAGLTTTIMTPETRETSAVASASAHAFAVPDVGSEKPAQSKSFASSSDSKPEQDSSCLSDKSNKKQNPWSWDMFDTVQHGTLVRRVKKTPVKRDPCVKSLLSSRSKVSKSESDRQQTPKQKWSEVVK